MKKTMIILACLMMLGMQSVKAAEYAQIVLQHNGNVTQFGFDQLVAAIAAAETGDTLFLSAGSYKSSGTYVTIDKAITIIGAGADNTEIANGIYVEIPNSPTLTARLLDGVRISGNLYVQAAVTGVVLRKCRITNTLGFISGRTNIVKEMVLDRCGISDLILGSALGSLTANNSNIYGYVYGSGYADQSAVFVNCDIRANASHSIGAHFRNCRITANNWYSYNEFTRFTNCLAVEGFTGFNGTRDTNCYTYSGALTDTSNEYFVSQGWVGTDGTAVGMYGTPTPYTLTPSGLSVTNYTLGVDTEKKQLNVKMTLGSH